MTKKLEELFGLSSDDENTESSAELPMIPEISPETMEAIDKVEAALPQVRGLESSDQEMDELASNAMNSYNDLMSLGMNIDARYASEIFSVASNMLGHAITAKTAKLNKKLKMVDLQMKKMSLDRKQGDAGPATATGNGYVINRNELLEKLLQGQGKMSPKE
jgi:pyruvate formate-lyase activating enzyme-like uncharacterized protein